MEAVMLQVSGTYEPLFPPYVSFTLIREMLIALFYLLRHMAPSDFLAFRVGGPDHEAHIHLTPCIGTKQLDGTYEVYAGEPMVHVIKSI